MNVRSNEENTRFEESKNVVTGLLQIILKMKGVSGRLKFPER